MFLPPYSPDLNPIELMWAHVKSSLRTQKARTYDALISALNIALPLVSLLFIQNWFAHCGYSL